ncbi:hypothetical protein POM88_046016 [Heracleum sosnowskyi]|uniref:protein-disulfide reductase n=1 Tax=Heracleum sosnowskyi TaxID=360622 RepID=A0AAD8H8J2_9APIA|nr:hypothetical protein POM88_046016 [Heracleum sosnowskyi]
MSRANLGSPPNIEFWPLVFTEYPERICNTEVEAKVGSNSIGTVTSNATKNWNELKKQNIKYQKIRKGDVIDLHEFLFTTYRDCLIRNDGKPQVMAEQLAGKVIIMYFVSLSLNPRDRLLEESDTFLLTNIYNYLPYRHGVEIVFVAINGEDERESKKQFEDIFSRMPWTAIPFFDVFCWRNLVISFHVNDTTTLFVVDSSDTVLQRDAKFIIEDYGVLGFPYSDDRIKLLHAEDDSAVQHPSLMTLLGSLNVIMSLQINERKYLFTLSTSSEEQMGRK